VALAIAAALAGCADSPSAAGASEAQAPAPAPEQPDQVVAEVGGRRITLKDVDAKWEAFDAAERARVVQLLYQNRRAMLDQLVGDALLEDAAKAAGLSVDAYTDQEIAKRSAPVTETDIKAFYDENRDRAQGRTLDDLRQAVRDYLDGQRKAQARAQLIGELRQKSGRVKVLLEPPRYPVALAAHDPVRGEPTAPVTIVEFSDYQCPYCQRVGPILTKLRQSYGSRVRLIYKDFPLPNHPHAFKAAEAAQCAGEQGKYWEMHDRMFANQAALDVPALKASAAALGLNADVFNQCLDSGKFAHAIREDMAVGEKLGVNSTPTVYINGRAVIGAQPFEAFRSIIEEELRK
jgi:protein-disulfide isomerase